MPPIAYRSQPCKRNPKYESRCYDIDRNASFVAFLSGCPSSDVAMTSSVPEILKVSATQTLSLAAQANGYECNASKTDPTVFEWAFKASEAELFNNDGKKIGKHYAGPTWEADDGSKVIGEVKARGDGPDTNAIPWLLLAAKSVEGNGVFAKTQSIQRVNTVGGKTPAVGAIKRRRAVSSGSPIAPRTTFTFRDRELDSNFARQSQQHLVERDGKIAHAYAGCVEHRIRDGRVGAAVAELTESLGAKLVRFAVKPVKQDGVDFGNVGMHRYKVFREIPVDESASARIDSAVLQQRRAHSPGHAAD